MDKMKCTFVEILEMQVHRIREFKVPLHKPQKPNAKVPFALHFGE
jgi:hypothetical protein